METIRMDFYLQYHKMKEMASRGYDKGLGDWLDNQDVCQMLKVSRRTLQEYRNDGVLP